MLKTPINYLPDPTQYIKNFCDYIFNMLIEKIEHIYHSIKNFTDKKLITFLTNEKIANEFNKTKNMELDSLIKEFYNIHQKIKIPVITVNQKLTIESKKEINKVFNNSISLTIIFYKICIIDDATNNDISDFFIEKYRKKITNIFKNLYYLYYHYYYLKYFRIKNTKERQKNKTKKHKDNLDIELIKEIKKSLQYALLTINKMDTDIHKRNLKVMPKEDLQKKAEMAEAEKNTLISDKKTNVNNCLIS